MGGNIPFRPPWLNDGHRWLCGTLGLVGYTDDQAMQDAHGRGDWPGGMRLRPPMPRFQMTPEDAAAVIAYMRTR